MKYYYVALSILLPTSIIQAQHKMIQAIKDGKKAKFYEYRNIQLNPNSLLISKKNRFTLLEYCIIYNRLEMAQNLLNTGADPNLKSHDEKTPLCYAQSIEMLELLKNHGAVFDEITLAYFRKIQNHQQLIFRDFLSKSLSQT